MRPLIIFLLFERLLGISFHYAAFTAYAGGDRGPLAGQILFDIVLAGLMLWVILPRPASDS